MVNRIPRTNDLGSRLFENSKSRGRSVPQRRLAGADQADMSARPNPSVSSGRAYLDDAIDAVPIFQLSRLLGIVASFDISRIVYSKEI